MKKPVIKEKIVKKPKEDNKTDVIYVRYLLEDMGAVAELIPSDEKERLNEATIEAILAAVKKVHLRVKSISKLFKQKYAVARFDKIEEVSNSILKKGKENPRFRYAFVLKEFKNCTEEIAKTIVGK